MVIVESPSVKVERVAFEAMGRRTFGVKPAGGVAYQRRLRPDIRELGNVVAGASAHPDQAGHGEHLPFVGDFMELQ